MEWERTTYIALRFLEKKWNSNKSVHKITNMKFGNNYYLVSLLFLESIFAMCTIMLIMQLELGDSKGLLTIRFASGTGLHACSDNWGSFSKWLHWDFNKMQHLDILNSESGGCFSHFMKCPTKWFFTVLITQSSNCSTAPSSLKPYQMTSICLKNGIVIRPNMIMMSAKFKPPLAA